MRTDASISSNRITWTITWWHRQFCFYRAATTGSDLHSILNLSMPRVRHHRIRNGPPRFEREENRFQTMIVQTLISNIRHQRESLRPRLRKVRIFILPHPAHAIAEADIIPTADARIFIGRDVGAQHRAPRRREHSSTRKSHGGIRLPSLLRRVALLASRNGRQVLTVNFTSVYIDGRYRARHRLRHAFHHD